MKCAECDKDLTGYRLPALHPSGVEGWIDVHTNSSQLLGLRFVIDDKVHRIHGVAHLIHGVRDDTSIDFYTSEGSLMRETRGVALAQWAVMVQSRGKVLL